LLILNGPIKLADNIIDSSLWYAGVLMSPAVPLAPTPIVTAMLLCDTSIHEAVTNKITLVGLFGRWFTQTFPAELPAFRVYARIADMDGDYVFRLDVVELSNDSRIATITAPSMTSRNPLDYFDLTMIFPGIRFERAGRYEFQLYANDEYIGRTTATVTQLEVQQP
jgi:hypothetical protein